MPHPIIEISELTQLLADHLLLDSPRSLVSLACTCRALEEQALSILWSRQSSLETLVRSTLPLETLSPSRPLPQPTRMEWNKFRRYASWMRRLRFHQNCNVPDEVLRMISDNSPDESLCRGLRELVWITRPYPLDRLFLSSHLTVFSFLCTSLSGQLPDEVFLNLASVIAELQTSSLQSLRIRLPIAAEQTPTSLRSAVSSAVLRCGPSLTTLSVPTPLSDEAVKHLMQLPKLTTWEARNGPPGVSDPSLSNAFLQLETLELHVQESLEWLPLFEAATRRISSGQDARALSNRGPGQKLTTLASRVQVPIDAAFISPIKLFHGLVNLALRPPCFGTGGCAFDLTDDDIAEIATALPNLVGVTFGGACPANSCRTTVSSLLLFSTRCKNLRYLDIHFNTTNLLDDFRSMVEDPRPGNLCALPRCQLTQLSVSHAPLRMEEESYGAVVAGFLSVFPLLHGIFGVAECWDRLNSKLCNEE